MKTWYIIPARKGSKGLPHKNRRLFNKETIFYKTSNKVDIDNDIDYNAFKSENSSINLSARR